MGNKTRQRLAAIVRIALAVVFVAWALHGLTWHDRVTLTRPVPGDASPPPHRYQLIAETDGVVRVRTADGQSVDVARAQVALDDTGEPRIERGFVSAIRRSDLGIIGWALLAFAPVPLLQSWRFKLLLQAQEIRLTYWECVKLSFGGNFLNFVFLLGTTAGDVFKAYYTALHTEHKTEAVTTVLLDRFVGLAGLLLVAVLAMFAGSDSELLHQLRWYAVAFLVALGAAAMMVTWSPLRRLVPSRWLERCPGWSQIKRAHGATDRLLRHKTLVAGALLIAMVLQFVAIGSFVICADALRMNFSSAKVWDYFAYIGSGQVIAAVPITPQGLGTMEVAYKKFFLGSYGTLSQLLCLALLLRLVQFAWALPGALVTLMGAHKPRPAADIAHLNEPVTSQS